MCHKCGWWDWWDHDSAEHKAFPAVNQAPNSDLNQHMCDKKFIWQLMGGFSLLETLSSSSLNFSVKFKSCSIQQNDKN